MRDLSRQRAAPSTSRWTLPYLKRPWLRRLLLKLYALQLPRVSTSAFLKIEAGERYANVAHDAAALELCSQTLVSMASGAKSAGFANDFAIFVSEEIIGTASCPELPMLILHDEKDPLAPVEHVEWFISVFPHCERVCLRAGGHLVWVGPEADRMHSARAGFVQKHARRTIGTLLLEPHQRLR